MTRLDYIVERCGLHVIFGVSQQPLTVQRQFTALIQNFFSSIQFYQMHCYFNFYTTVLHVTVSHILVCICSVMCLHTHHLGTETNGHPLFLLPLSNYEDVYWTVLFIFLFPPSGDQIKQRTNKSGSIPSAQQTFLVFKSTIFPPLSSQKKERTVDKLSL